MVGRVGYDDEEQQSKGIDDEDDSGRKEWKNTEKRIGAKDEDRIDKGVKEKVRGTQQQQRR